MTADGFRKLALNLPEATEAAHMGHPDFRVRGKIFVDTLARRRLGHGQADAAAARVARGSAARGLRAGQGRLGPSRVHQRASAGGDKQRGAGGAGCGMAQRRAQTARERVSGLTGRSRSRQIAGAGVRFAGFAPDRDHGPAICKRRAELGQHLHRNHANTTERQRDVLAKDDLPDGLRSLAFAGPSPAGHGPHPHRFRSRSDESADHR